MTPGRVADTRAGSGYQDAGAPVGPGGSINVQIAGTGGAVPAGATAAVVNVTAVNPTAASFLSVYPKGAQRNASALNFVAGQTVANQVTVPLNSSGAITVFNHAGSVDVVVDIDGYYTSTAPASGGGQFNTTTPSRVLGTAAAGATAGPNSVTPVTVTGGTTGVPADATAVVVNLTESGATAPGYMTVYPAGVASRPPVSNLNFPAGQAVANRAVVQVGTNGQIDVYNYTGTAGEDVDIVGYYTGSATEAGGTFVPLTTPTRVVDTRQPTPAPAGATAIPTNGVESFTLGSVVPAGDVAVTNLTATPGTQTQTSSDTFPAPGYFTVLPSGTSAPTNGATTSDVNWYAGEIAVPNATYIPTDANGAFEVYNHGVNPANALVDVFGYFNPPSAAQTGFVALSNSSAQPSGTVTGKVTNPGSVSSLTVSGCGMSNQAINNFNPGPFSFTIPSTAPNGSCTLTFTATDTNGSVTTTNVPFTVGSTAAAGQTSLPQLTSASILRTVTTANATAASPAGTTVQYVFDQKVTGDAINATGFHVYDAAGNRYTPLATSAATIDSANPDAVDVFYGNTSATDTAAGVAPGAGSDLTTTSGAANLTLATVAGPQDNNAAAAAGTGTGPAAVVSPAGASPDGSAAIGTSSTTAATAAGVTIAPNPESFSVTNTSGANPTTYPNGTPVNVTFDKAAVTQTAATFPTTTTASSSGFDAVLTTTTGGVNEVACYGPAPGDLTTPSGGTVTGGNGTTTLTIVCQDTAAGTPITAAQIGRIIVQPGAVATTAATGSVVNKSLQAADAPHNATDSPDLTSTAFVPGTGSTADRIVYTFDKPVTLVGTAGSGFGFYTASAQQFTCGPTTNTLTAGQAFCSATVNPNNFDQVIVTVNTINNGGATSSGATANATGANVAAGSVASQNVPTNKNGDDELGAANPNNTGSAITPGSVNAPQLTTVHLVTTTSPITGNSTSAVYTFSQPVAANGTGNPANITAFHLYDQDGTELTCTAANATVGTGANSNQVTCSSFTQAAGGGATPATATQLSGAVLGTVDYDAVAGAANTSTGAVNPGSGNVNPEGGVAVS